MAVIIRSSSLHGAGVYTTSAISEGTRILEYTGPRLRARQTDGMYADSEVTYLFGMDDGKTVIDGFGMAAFVNHSCHPNCETDQIEDRIWIIALQDIAAGEELTYDYNIYDAEPGEECPCHCGAVDCRKTMYSEEEIARQETILKGRKKRRSVLGKRRRTSHRRSA
ncbi:MAG TPA: SET domain-containing protein-lysine N-methyltransferase [Candidatus Angelobacter sp.]|nr:SET domain-containing protein-lysine N-methyltransferase [Candidatus Angelobacter sp.]